MKTNDNRQYRGFLVIYTANESVIERQGRLIINIFVCMLFHIRIDITSPENVYLHWDDSSNTTILN